MSAKNAGIKPVTLEEKEEKIKAKDVKDVLLVAIRIRGNVNKYRNIKKTFEILRLHKANHAVLLKATPSINGLLFKVKDFIAYGIINEDTLAKMLAKRARLNGHKPLDGKSVKKFTGKDSYDDLAAALINFELKYTDIKDICPVFRLHPPRGGFPKGLKVQRSMGGVLGFHGKDINKIVVKMI
ncbi:50S ribosomal protein L30 [Candidatus Bathyarchaeota archaeon]|nr:50S ribosomal protein L30 [Candidatus Bathyarchaeota archaeon]